jgi:predicted ferric reductase
MPGIAEAAGPIAMWLVIGAAVVGVLYFIYRSIGSAAVAKDDLGEVADAAKENKDALEHLRKNRSRLRALWRAGRVRDRQDP